MENKVATSVAGDKDSFIVCRNSQGAPVRGSLMHFSNQNAIFEVYNPFSILQLSEVLNDFRIMIGDRTLYAGRSVVSSLVNTGIMLVCEVTLVDPWNNVDIFAVFQDPQVLRGEAQRFVTDWRANNDIIPDFKVLTSDFQGFLSELSLWLKQVEMSMSKTAPKDSDQLNLELVEKVIEPVRPVTQEFLYRLEDLGRLIPPELAAVHKAYIRRDLHPLTLCCPFVHRTFTKPLGYAGDFAMINMILGDPRQGGTLFSKAINALVLEADVAEAHRNRIKILTRSLEAEGIRAQKEGRSFKVLNIACGPAREVADFIRSSPEANRCVVTLLDFSREALDYARIDLTRTKETARSQIELIFVEKSIDTMLRESITRGPKSGFMDEKFDFVYCAGLFDYLSDSVCRRLLAMFYEWLLPGGILMATNVHAANPQKMFMEYLLEWNIVHRNEAQMEALIELGEQKRVFVDETGVNVFISVKRHGG